MYCKKCGAKNKDGARFCAKCGQELTQKSQVQKRDCFKFCVNTKN